MLSFLLACPPQKRCSSSPEQSIGQSVHQSFCKHPVRAFNSDSQTYKNHREFIKEAGLGLSTRDFDSGLRQGPRLCILDTLPRRCGYIGHSGPYSEKLRLGVRYKGLVALVGREEAVNMKDLNPPATITPELRVQSANPGQAPPSPPPAHADSRGWFSVN